MYTTLSVFSRRAFTASRRNYRYYPVYFPLRLLLSLTVGSLRASVSLADICNLSVSLAVSANHTKSVFYDVSTIATDCKHWFTTSFLQPLPYLVTP